MLKHVEWAGLMEDWSKEELEEMVAKSDNLSRQMLSNIKTDSMSMSLLLEQVHNRTVFEKALLELIYRR